VQDTVQNNTESPVHQNRVEIQTNSKQIHEGGVHKRPVQKVIPSRNCSALSSQVSSPGQILPLVNGNRVDYGEKNGAITIGLNEGSCYIKPSSPIKTPTSLALPPGSAGIPSPKLVTASVGYVHSPVPVSANGSQHRPSSLGQTCNRSPKIGTTRGITWNRDVPPEKLSFTMRREFDKAREEAELIEQLRSVSFITIVHYHHHHHHPLPLLFLKLIFFAPVVVILVIIIIIISNSTAKLHSCSEFHSFINVFPSVEDSIKHISLAS